MKLNSIQLKNFRTYANLSLDFDSRLSFITGPNAAGKTNLIEAISMLSLGKSFRGASDRNMIRYETSGYHIAGRYERMGRIYQLETGCDVSTQQIRRRIRLNGKLLSGRSELIGNFITVIFSPADLMIVEGGSAIRRRFLDALLSSQDREYLKNLILYGRALKQRNAILKRIREKKARIQDLQPWNANLIQFAQRIIGSRVRFIEEFQDIFTSSLLRISDFKDRISLKLIYSSEIEERDYVEALEKNTMKDIMAGYTVTGPHRHNLSFRRGDQDVIHFGSQGQKRSIVLALRMAEFYYLKKSLKLSPLLLIDDVIRELDAKRRESFVQLLHESGQAIFTTPDLDGLEGFMNTIRDELTIFRVEDEGRVAAVEP